jgi:hypothetical protein
MIPKTTQPKSMLTSLFSSLVKNFSMLFESGSQRDFQRLKNFIAS